MKNLFLSAFGVFTLSLMFCLSYQNDNFIENSAFADGTCCNEMTSTCILNGQIYPNKYYKTEGSCKPTPVIE